MSPSELEKIYCPECGKAGTNWTSTRDTEVMPDDQVVRCVCACGFVCNVSFDEINVFLDKHRHNENINEYYEDLGRYVTKKMAGKIK